MAIAVVDNSSPTSGDLNDEAWDAYNATVTALLLQHGTDGSHGASGDAVPRALFDVNTILYATTDDTPVALTVAASRIVGRKSTGNIVALTAAEVLTILGLEADLANLTEAEVDQLEAIGATTISAAQWGYVGALTTDPIGGDGTAGRIMRVSYIVISNGTTGVGLKCTVGSIWNGDTIAETDDITKGATTGDFTLNAGGTVLSIEVSGLIANALAALASDVVINACGTDITNNHSVSGNDIHVDLRNSTTGGTLDLTTLVDTGSITIVFCYLTDA